MLIDVRDIADRRKDFSFNEDLTLSRSGIDIPCTVAVTGQVYKANGDYITEGSIKAVLNLSCDLCLTSFKSELDMDLNEVYSETPDPDKELWELSDKTIDLKPAVIANIMLSLPMQVLCSEQCKGLCPKCGHNLNDGDCGCDRGYVNPQFEGLLKLFNDE